VRFAPFTELECVVLDVERTLNGPAARYSCPAIGQDIKVMGIRHGSEISLTIACAFVDRYTANLDAYIAHKAHVERVAREAAGRVAGLPVAAPSDRLLTAQTPYASADREKAERLRTIPQRP
jgi:S-adenosylmethionine synthetase